MNQGRELVLQFKERIYSEIFQQMHRIGENSFTRERKLTFPIVFSTILKLVKKSLGIECELMEPLVVKIPPSKQAFSKARYKICHTGFKELLELSIETTYRDPTYGTWRGARRCSGMAEPRPWNSRRRVRSRMPPRWPDICRSLSSG